MFSRNAAMLQRRAQNLKIGVITPIFFDTMIPLNLPDLAGQVISYIFPKPKREPLPQMMGGSSTHFGENYLLK